MKYNRKKRATSYHHSFLKFPLKRKKISSSHLNYEREIKEILKETPDMRMEKVEMFKKAIWAGTYWVESKKIAEKMIKESLFNLIL